MMTETFFDKFIKISGKELPDPSTLSTDDKAFLVFNLKSSGETMTAIANYLGVSRKYTYDLLKHAKVERIQELESRSFIEEVVEQLMELEATRDMLKKKAEFIRVGSDETIVDPETGLEVTKKGSTRDFTEMYRLIRDYDKIILDMKTKVGISPLLEPGAIYSSIREKNRVDTGPAQNDMESKNEPELIAILLDRLQSKPQALRDIKDEMIL